MRELLRAWVRKWGGRGVALALTGVGLYVVAPSLVGMLDAWPRLEAVRPLWFVVLGLLELASFACLWWLTRIAIARPRHLRGRGEPSTSGSGGAHKNPEHRRTRPTARWSDVAASQLAGLAASRVLPGGAATGGVVQGRMLVSSGQPVGRVASALVAVGSLTTGVLLTLPVLTVPAVIIGPPPARQLQLGLLVSLVVAVVIVGIGVTALTLPRVLARVGWLVGALVHVVRPQVTGPGIALLLSRQRARVAAAFEGRWWRSVLAAAGNRMLDYAALVAALVAVGAQARPSVVLLAYVVAMALAIVPITPGGLGFVETGLTGMLVLAGVSADGALVATLLFRLMSFWAPIPVGAVAWATWRVRRRPDVTTPTARSEPRAAGVTDARRG